MHRTHFTAGYTLYSCVCVCDNKLHARSFCALGEVMYSSGACYGRVRTTSTVEHLIGQDSSFFSKVRDFLFS